MDLYTDPADSVTFGDLVSFVLNAERTSAAQESSTFEFKRQLSKSNVAEAVAALANADGGLVFVGIDEKAGVSAKVVGIPRGDVDALVNNLRSLLPHDAFPEVLVLAKPDDGDRVVVLLRVDADVAVQPVVVGGKVLIRYPGQSVTAKREQIIELVHRAGAGDTGQELRLPGTQLQGPGTALFVEDAPVDFELRLMGSVTLPGRAAHRPWLDSETRRVAAAALSRSPLPVELWYDQQPPWGRAGVTWRENDARSTWMRLGSEREPNGRSELNAVGGAYLTLDGRALNVLLGVAARPARIVGNAPVPPTVVSYDAIYRGLLGLLVTHCRLVEAVTTSLGAAEPLRYGARQAWLLPSGELKVSDVVRLDTFGPRGPGGSEQMLHFVPLLSGAGLADLDNLARTWVEIAMLDAGMREFEPHLRDLPQPTWAVVD